METGVMDTDWPVVNEEALKPQFTESGLLILRVEQVLS